MRSATLAIQLPDLRATVGEEVKPRSGLNQRTAVTRTYSTAEIEHSFCLFKYPEHEVFFL